MFGINEVLLYQYFFDCAWYGGNLYIFLGSYREYSDGGRVYYTIYFFLGGYWEYGGGGWAYYFDWSVIEPYTFPKQCRPLATPAEQAG